jgi:outer membrane receptor protein involved in Fe transport
MDGDALVLGMGRRGTETGPRHYSFERESFSATLGLRGDIGDSENQWSWDIFGQFQRSRTDSLTEGQYSLTRLALGLDAVDDGMGNAVCRTQILGCVPVNPFGLGSITEAAGDFIATNRTSDNIFERSIVGASIAGNLLELPAGQVPIVVGFEYRDDFFNFTPGATDLGGEYGTGSLGITEGAYNVKEFFSEVRIPILADMTFFETLAIEGAVRYSDYSNFGGALTWKVMGEWAPVEWLRFRSAYNRALRAPTLNELFSPRVEGFTSGDDPCDIDNTPTAAMQALCVTQGVAPGDIATFQQLDIGFRQSSGGNPSLNEESSRALTVGAVIRPPFLEGFNLTADYYTIEVEDAIAQIGAQQIVDTCFTLLDNSSAPCQAITRLANGQISLVSASLNNIGLRKVRGVDLQADYTVDLPNFFAVGDEGSQVSFMVAAGWVFENSNQVVGAAPRDCAGFFAGGCTGQSALALPDFKLTGNATYQSGPLSVRMQVRYLGDLQPFPGVATTLEAGSVVYFDLSAAIRLRDNLEFYGGIDNLTDVQPPILGFNFGGDANTDPVLWDVIGRRFFIGARAHF